MRGVVVMKVWQCWMWAWYLEWCSSPGGVAVLDVGVVPGGVWFS